jgi:hypothetical protein
MTNKQIANQIVDNINNLEGLQKLTISDEILGTNIGSGDTALHQIFSEVDLNKECMQHLLSNIKDLKSLLEKQNASGDTPIEAIENKEQFEKVSAFFDNHAKDFLTAKSCENVTYLQLQLAEDEPKVDLINAVVEFAKTQNVLKETLMAKDKFKQTPVTTAIAKNNVNFITNVFGKLIDEDKTAILAQTLNSQENLLHTAFRSEEIDIVKFFANKIAANDKTALTSDDTAEMLLSLLLKNKHFVAAFKALDNKTVILEAILENITDLKTEAGFSENFAAVYTDIKDTEALKDKVLAEIDLDGDCNNFPEAAIKDKLTAEEKSLADGIQGNEAETLKTALETIEGYNSKFKGKIPENFGNSVKEAVKTKLNAITDAQKAFSAESASDLETKLKTAESAIYAYSEVYNKLADKTVTLKNAKTALNEAVQAKAQILVNAECKNVSTLAQANSCKSLINSSRNDGTLKDAVGADFAKTELEQAEKTIAANTIQPADLLKGTVLAFYMFKDKQVLKVMDKYAAATSKSKDIPANLKTLINLKTEIDDTMNKVMGIASDKSSNSIDIYDKNYHSFYSKGMLSVKPGKFINNFGNQDKAFFKEYFAKSWEDEDGDQVGYIHQNMEGAKDETCKAFKLSNENCQETKILEVIHDEHCKDKSDLTDPADKLFCSKGDNDQYKFTEVADFAMFTELTDMGIDINNYIN